MIPYGKQHITDQDIDAVVQTLKSDWLTQGPTVPQFESSIAKKVKAQFAIAVNSATSALHIACLTLDLGPEDTVWTTPNSFVASANCALYCGATVDFVDIELNTGNMCVQALESKLQLARQLGKLPKIVIPVHFAGQPCDMREIKSLSLEYGFKIIEDASHAIGAHYCNEPIGSCIYSDICIFSFHPVKIITTGEGGMAVTQSEEYAKKMRLLRSHGVTNQLLDFEQPSDGLWYYEQQELGFNYRMTDLQAALGLSQLSRLDEYVLARNQIAQNFTSLLSNVSGVEPLHTKSNIYSSYHLFVVLLENANSDYHKKVISELRASGVYAHVHYIPIYLQPYYRKRGFKPGYCPNAEMYYSRAVTLPLHPQLCVDQQQYILNSLKACL